MKLSFSIMGLTVLLFVNLLFAADKEALQKELEVHKARSESTWRAFAGGEIKNRIVPAPDVILDYIKKDNQVQGYKEIPKRPEIEPGFFSDIVNAVTELPPLARGHIEKHVVAIFLVEELGGTGYTELLRDFANNRQGFIVLDVGSLNRKANEWITWKANSPFAKKNGYIIEAEIEQKKDDTRKASIQYILVHEVGHLLGVAYGAHPNWLKGGHPQKWAFTKLSWLTSGQGLDGQSKFDTAFTNRVKLKFYSFKNAPLTTNEIDETYTQLLNTNFVSLYAATNMYDDFAETYGMYVHVVLQNRQWKIRIIKEGKTVREIVNPILDKRCENKKIYLDKMFK